MCTIRRYAKLQLEVAEQLPAFGDRPDDGAEVVVEQHDRGHLARAARAALAHRDADVGGLQRRHVVHAVTGDRHDLTGGLQRRTRSSLCDGMARATTSTPSSVGRRQRPRDRSASIDDGAVGAQPDLGGDRGRGDRMVAGHHHHADAGRRGSARRHRDALRARDPRRRAGRRSGRRSGSSPVQAARSR